MRSLSTVKCRALVLGLTMAVAGISESLAKCKINIDSLSVRPDICSGDPIAWLRRDEVVHLKTGTVVSCPDWDFAPDWVEVGHQRFVANWEYGWVAAKYLNPDCWRRPRSSRQRQIN
jgi:hypothetical protein